jgi:HEAT repeat protein
MPGTRRRCRTILAVGLVVAALAAGCDKATHENLDKWMSTEKGPDKLSKALSNGSIDPDLSAHAAANLIKLGKDADVRKTIEGMPDDRRQAVIAKLAPRLWDMARIEGELTMPSGLQTNSKDLLFELRKGAGPEARQQIDGYLMDWYTSGYYEGRAPLGRHLGATVIRTLGPPAGEKLKHAANAIIAAPARGNERAKVGDELLLGMAASGNPDAVQYVLDIYHMDRGDSTLPERCVSALYRAYVDPGGLFDVNDSKALEPSMDRLAEIAKDESQSPRVTNDAVALVRAVGMPRCLDPLVSLIPSPNRQRRWQGANNALKCGGPKAIAPVAGALATDTSYDHAEMAGAVWEEIAKMSPRDQVLAEVRKLLDSPSWVARWVGAEALASMKSKDDVARLKALAGDKATLTGYWGDQSGVDAKDRKADPTLGERVTELAKSIESGA